MPEMPISLIAATYRSNDALGPIINKKKRGSKLTPEEEKEWMTAWRSAGTDPELWKESRHSSRC